MKYEGTFQTGVNSEQYKQNYDLIFRKALTDSAGEPDSSFSDTSLPEGDLANPR